MHQCRATRRRWRSPARADAPNARPLPRLAQRQLGGRGHAGSRTPAAAASSSVVDSRLRQVARRTGAAEGLARRDNGPGRQPRWRRRWEWFRRGSVAADGAVRGRRDSERRERRAAPGGGSGGPGSSGGRSASGGGSGSAPSPLPASPSAAPPTSTTTTTTTTNTTLGWAVEAGRRRWRRRQAAAAAANAAGGGAGGPSQSGGGERGRPKRIQLLAVAAMAAAALPAAALAAAAVAAAAVVLAVHGRRCRRCCGARDHRRWCSAPSQSRR